MDDERKIAYFSMEIALEAGMATYSGGLGVLAGDTIRSAADLKLPMVAVTLIHRRGYFRQRLDPTGWQIEEPVDWVVENFLSAMPQRVAVTIEGRTVHLRACKYEVIGMVVASGYRSTSSIPISRTIPNGTEPSRIFFTEKINITGFVRKRSWALEE